MYLALCLKLYWNMVLLQPSAFALNAQMRNGRQRTKFLEDFITTYVKRKCLPHRGTGTFTIKVQCIQWEGHRICNMEKASSFRQGLELSRWGVYIIDLYLWKVCCLVYCVRKCSHLFIWRPASNTLLERILYVNR